MNNSSMADYLRIVTPFLHENLMASSRLSAIERLARELPPYSLAGFECRLQDEDSRVDFIAKLPSKAVVLPELFHRFPQGEALKSFQQEWLLGNFPIYAGLDSMGLEFDIEDLSSLPPFPSVLLELNSDIQWQRQQLFDVVFPLLDPEAVSSNEGFAIALRTQLDRCVSCLPEGSQITNLGIMLSRPVLGVRVVVKGISTAQFPSYLEEIGWTDSTQQLPSLITFLNRLANEIALSFDVGDGIYPRIGLECHLSKQPKRDRGWEIFLERLVEKQLCSPVKKEALLSWPGISQQADHPEIWPQDLLWGDAFFRDRAFSVFCRTLHEVKIVYQPHCPPFAKAYLGFEHRWVDALSEVDRNVSDSPSLRSSGT